MLFFILFLFPRLASAQDPFQVSGTVVDSVGEVLIGVGVKVKGSGEGTLTGRVSTDDGSAIVGAVVTLTGCGSPIPITTTSGASGKFTASQVPAGSYTVSGTYGQEKSNPITVTLNNKLPKTCRRRSKRSACNAASR